MRRFEKDVFVSTEIKPKSYQEWGTDFIAGSMKTLFIPSIKFGREISEFVVRADVDHQTTTFDRISALNEWGTGDFYAQRGGIGNFDLPHKNIEEAVTCDDHYDVMVIPGCMGWGFFSSAARKAILERVKNGAGLILIAPFNGEAFEDVEELDLLSPLKPKFSVGSIDTEKKNPILDNLKIGEWIPEEHYITRGIPFELIPFGELGYFPYEATSDATVIVKSESGDPIVAVKEYGKGRVVTVAYYARDILPMHNEFLGWDDCDDSLTSNWHGAFYSTTYNYLEYFYSFMNRAMLWASGKAEKCCAISDAYVLNNSRTGTDLKIIIDKGNNDYNLDIEYTILDMYDNVVFSGGQTGSFLRDFREEEDVVDIYALNDADDYDRGILDGVARIKLPEFIGYGGKYAVNFKLVSEGRTCDWYTRVVDIPTKADISELTTDKTETHKDEKIGVLLNVDWNKCAIAYFDQATIKKPNPMAGPSDPNANPEIEKSKMHNAPKDTRSYQNLRERKFANPEECEARGTEYEDYRQEAMAFLGLPEASVEISLIDAFDRILDRYNESVDLFVAASDEEKSAIKAEEIDKLPLLTDTKGRRIIKETPISKKVNCNLKVTNGKSIKVFVHADLKINGHVVKRLVSSDIIIAIEDRNINDFEVFIAPQNRGFGDFLALERERLIEMGSTALYYGDNKVQTKTNTKGFSISWYQREEYVAMKENYFTSGDKSFLKRKLCMNSPEFYEINTKNISEIVPDNVKYKPITYGVNDEGSLTCYSDELDLCFCEHCMRDMRKWLQTEYENLEALNESWSRKFSTWEEIVPDTLYEAKSRGEFASWGDHKRFMYNTVTKGYRIIKELVDQYDKDAKLSVSGTQVTTPYSGYDYYSIHEYISSFRSYVSGGQLEIHRSFKRPGTNVGVWFGYGQRYKYILEKAWQVLFHEGTMANIFWEYACMNPDFTFSGCGKDLGKVFREIRREGIGKMLLYAARRDALNIGIHYSVTSINGVSTRNEFGEFTDNRMGWMNVLEDLGYQYNFIDSRQVEEGELKNKGYKVFVLPYSISLSSKETENIRQFVADGGFLIADYQTGIMDEHNKLFKDGSIDDVLGIKRLMNITWEVALGDEFEATKDFEAFDNTCIMPTIKYTEFPTRTTTAKAAFVDGFTYKVPLVSFNDYEKGKAVYLNFSLSGYPNVRSDGSGKSTMEIIKAVMGAAKIEQFAAIEDSEGNRPFGVETIYYSDGSAKYVGFQRGLGGKTVTGGDGVSYGVEGDTHIEGKLFNIRFSEIAHIYDVRAKKYIGYTDVLSTEIEKGDSRLYSILAYKVNVIEVDIKNEYKCGETIAARIIINTDKPAEEYRNVIAINAYTPSGKYFPLFSENVITETNEIVFERSTALNEEKGLWKFTFKDVATGVETVKPVKIF